MTIHSGHPFATPPGERDAVRRLRGRLVSPVTLWLAGHGARRVGLTVGSVLVALGEPARVVGLVDPDTDFAHEAGERWTVVLLAAGDRALADAFAGLAPAPGGVFRGADFVDTAWGPTLPARSWAGVRLETRRTLGWSDELVGVVEHVELADATPLAHLRGAYLAL